MHPFDVNSNNVLSLCPRATGVRTVRVSRELNLLRSRQLQDLLEATADGQEGLLALLGIAALAASNIAITTPRDALANGTGPDTHTVEGLADVDDDSHDLAVLLILQGLANSAHHDLQPEAVDIDAALVLVLVGPLATVLVLRVLPLGPDAGLEQVVVGLEGELGDMCNVVLARSVKSNGNERPVTYVYAPELLN